jgi:hypothetical protein
MRLTSHQFGEPWHARGPASSEAYTASGRMVCAAPLNHQLRGQADQYIRRIVALANYMRGVSTEQIEEWLAAGLTFPAVNDRRAKACLKACEGIPTEDLEAGLVGAMAKLCEAFRQTIEASEAAEAARAGDVSILGIIEVSA